MQLLDISINEAIKVIDDLITLGKCGGFKAELKVYSAKVDYVKVEQERSIRCV